MPDACFDDPRLARVYDALDPDRSDLEFYLAAVARHGANRVLDIGCGTGTFAILLAQRGLDVTGLDPASASLDVARGKPDADLVRWVNGDAPALRRRLPAYRTELATMTANVAQVFTEDEEWVATLDAIHAMLEPGGRLVFETRIPARRAWEEWDGPGVDVEIPGVGRVSDSYEVLEVHDRADGDVLVTFNSPTTFHAEDVTIDSVSTLRFREREGLARSLDAAGFDIEDVADAPDRPGREWMFTCGKR